MLRRAPLFALALTTACGNDGGGGDPADARDDGFDRAAMLARIADEVVIPAHDELVTTTAALRDATATACDAAAQQAWRDALAVWQRIDPVLVGPAAMDDKALRDRIYVWPLYATCGIDREVTAYWADPDAYDVTLELANVRSLAAIEYLLFNTSTAHTCAAPPNGWDALGADLPAARCGLAAELAADVATAAALARTGWDGYRDDFVASGIAGENLVSDSLFFVDRMVKDMKVGEAAGITINACGTIQEPCLREVEHLYADHGTPAIRANLRGLAAAWPGFDAHLRAVGAIELADRMSESLDGAIAAADAVPESYLGALADDRDLVVALHVATKLFTDDLKSQFLTVLGLEIPDDIATDND
jgi:predicted lipoprotein